MKIGLVTPAPPGSTYGNRITALRWARILRRLGHRVSISQEYEAQSYDLLIALHARRSYSSIVRFRRRHPGAPIIVALTGTDLYRDIQNNSHAQESLDLASTIVVLQPMALDDLRPALQEKTRVIFQSVERTDQRSTFHKRVTPRSSADKSFDVCVIGHLRPVKDPFRTALATRLLTDDSKIRVLHIGRAMTETMARRARAEMKINSRYRWLGEQPPARVRRILGQCRLCVVSSRMEGGANVLSEAIVASVPILASRINGNVGILGSDYPGLYSVGDTNQLARLLRRAETDRGFLKELKTHIRKLAPLFDSRREQQAWMDLIGAVKD
jgi:putative glycosyltransferase (TIGR04348 family)